MQLSAEEISQLSPEERLSLIEQLWDSLDDTEVPLPSEQQAELEHRLATLGTDRSEVISWESLRAGLARRSS